MIFTLLTNTNSPQCQPAAANERVQMLEASDGKSHDTTTDDNKYVEGSRGPEGMVSEKRRRMV